MAAPTDYTTGTITLTSGSPNFTTSGSALQSAQIRAGDAIIRNGFFLIIATITGENSGTLVENCPAAAAGTGVELRIRLQDGGSRLLAAYLTLIEKLGRGSREILAANRTYYVRTNGSDANDGLSNTAGGAFLTIQKAIDVVAALDIGPFSVTIQLADATYTAPVVVTGPWLGSGTVTVQGNAGTPANVLVSITSGTGFTVQTGGRLVVKDIKIQTTGPYCLYANGNGVINYANVVFGAAGNSHIRASDGGLAVCDGNYTISGNASFHWRSVASGVIRCPNRTITLTGTPAFTTFASATDGGAMVLNGNTFSGGATGTRYDATLNGVIDTAGGDATYLPGNASGTTATGGQYA